MVNNALDRITEKQTQQTVGCHYVWNWKTTIWIPRHLSEKLCFKILKDHSLISLSVTTNGLTIGPSLEFCSTETSMSYEKLVSLQSSTARTGRCQGVADDLAVDTIAVGNQTSIFVASSCSWSFERRGKRYCSHWQGTQTGCRPALIDWTLALENWTFERLGRTLTVKTNGLIAVRRRQSSCAHPWLPADACRWAGRTPPNYSRHNALDDGTMRRWARFEYWQYESYGHGESWDHN